MNWQTEVHKILSTPIPYSTFDDIDVNNIALYGAGSMGQMALDFMKLKSIKPKYIIDQKAKGSINGIDIVNIDQVPENERDTLVFIICIVTLPYIQIKEFLVSKDCKNIKHFYDFSEVVFGDKLSNGWSYFQVSEKDIDSIEEVCKALEHNKYSVIHYLQFLWWRLRRVEYIYDGFEVLSNQKYFKAPCFPKITDSERLFDAGAHFGTSIQSFLDKSENKYSKIWAIEPDKYNYDILKSNLKDYKNIEYFNIAIDSKNQNVYFSDNLGFASKIHKNGENEIVACTIDSLNTNPTILKLHLEGHELNALISAEETIVKNRPIIMVFADHNQDGLYKIAQLLISLDDYKLYFYLHDYCGNSAIFYAIPNERISNG